MSFSVFLDCCVLHLDSFVILLENDDVFKLSVYLDIYFFVCEHFARPMYWGTSVNDSKFI